MDWAEFVTQALAGAAANFGGVEAILRGRSGSWEAAGVRELLNSTVGHDESGLYSHRTKDVEITLYISELVQDHAYEAWQAYEDALEDVRRRGEEAETETEIDWSQTHWLYERGPDGASWVPLDPAAPAFDMDAWRAKYGEHLPRAEAEIRGETTWEGEPIWPLAGMMQPKSPELEAEAERLEAERDEQLMVFSELEEQLEEQRRAEWTSYGQVLKARIEASGAANVSIGVPVRVTIDIESHRGMYPDPADGVTLEDRLVASALLDTPTPADLPGTPLERLAQRTSTNDTEGEA